MIEPIETKLVEGEPVPVSALTRAVIGSPSLVTLKHDTEGQTMKVRIIRACGDWVEGDTTKVNADYGKQLIGNGLAEEVVVKPVAKAKST
jgi:transcription elongation GreA/GreB family factor